MIIVCAYWYTVDGSELRKTNQQVFFIKSGSLMCLRKREPLPLPDPIDSISLGFPFSLLLRFKRVDVRLKFHPGNQEYF